MRGGIYSRPSATGKRLFEYLDSVIQRYWHTFRDWKDNEVLDQFYEACMGTVHPNRQEQDDLLTKAGFKNIQRMPIGKGIFDFLMAEKYSNLNFV